MRGSAEGPRVTPARSERTLRVRKSSKSEADEASSWRATATVTKNGKEGRFRREVDPLPERETL
jgi:hypothetical protein